MLNAQILNKIFEMKIACKISKKISTFNYGVIECSEFWKAK